MKTKDGFVCTNEDLSYGGYILPRDQKLHHEPTDAERQAMTNIARAIRALERLGWRAPMYAPKDQSLLLIEARSTGLHEGYRDEISFWICDGDTWPSEPILWKPKP